MTKPRLTYFDAPVSRGEECRLALHIAGVDFDDRRVKTDDWPALKPTTPYGSNAILLYVGRTYGLHPTDVFEAAQHEGLMAHVEDLRANVSPTLRIRDEAEKKKAREALVASFLPTWAANAEQHLGDGPFVGGEKLHVVDLKLHMAVRWFNGGRVDHVPATIFADFPKLNRLHDAVRDDPRVKSWYAKT